MLEGQILDIQNEILMTRMKRQLPQHFYQQQAKYKLNSQIPPLLLDIRFTSFDGLRCTSRYNINYTKK